MPEVVTNLRQIINDNGYNIENISGKGDKGLPDRPQMNATKLKQKFDANISQLVDAIDNPDHGLTQAIFASLGEAGQGDMLASRYGTNRTDPENNTYLVDHSRYADKIKMSVKDNILYVCVSAPE